MTPNTIVTREGDKFVVDAELFERLNSRKWFSRYSMFRSKGHVYAQKRVRRDGKYITYPLHHEVLGLEPGEARAKGLVVDHIDGDFLNNRKANLRLVTQSENLRNSDYYRHYKGVSWSAWHGKWKGYTCKPNSATIQHVGYFDTEQAAVAAVEKAKIERGHGADRA